MARGSAEGRRAMAPYAEAVAESNPLISLITAVTGKSSIRGDELEGWERALNAPGVPDAAAGTIFKGLKGASKFDDLAEHIDEVTDAERAGSSWERATEKLADESKGGFNLLDKFKAWRHQRHAEKLAANLQELDNADGIVRDRSIWQPHHVVAVNDPRREGAEYPQAI